MTVHINVNGFVKVRLTQAGIDELNKQRKEFYGDVGMAFKPIEDFFDSSGYLRTQLWSLMSKLGHMCTLGGTPPFEMDIIVETPNTEE